MFKKKFIPYIILILSLIILIFLIFLSLENLKKQHIAAEYAQSISKFDTSAPFSVNKIVYFSSCDAKSNINANSSFTISNLYQYTDIAIFINNKSDENFSAKNTLKNVKLSNISYKLSPTIGTQNLYYKNINDFASSKYDDSKKIEDSLEFNTSSEDTIDYSTPTLFNNCANPITLCYINSDLKSNYTLTDNISNISYNGSLLKHCGITLNSIACNLSLLITITNNLDENYTCPINLNIPLSTENSTVYDGSLIVTDTPNYTFIRAP